MIEILLAALATRVDQETPPILPEPDDWDLLRLAVLLVALVVALAAAFIH